MVLVCVGLRTGVNSVRVLVVVRGRAGALGSVCARCSRPQCGRLGGPDAEPTRGDKGLGKDTLPGRPA